MNCPNCGAPVLDDAKFCANCGEKLPPVSAPAVKESQSEGAGEKTALENAPEITQTLTENAPETPADEKKQEKPLSETEEILSETEETFSETDEMFTQADFFSETKDTFSPVSVAEKAEVSAPVFENEISENKDLDSSAFEGEVPEPAAPEAPFAPSPLPYASTAKRGAPASVGFRVAALLALFFTACGIALLCLPLFWYGDDILKCVEDLLKDGSVILAVSCLLVPAALVIGMVLDFICSLKSAFRRAKSGGIQIVTLLLSSFLFVLVEEAVSRGNYILGEGDFAMGITSGAWYFYEERFFKNWILLAACFFFVSLLFQIAKIILFKKKKRALSGV